MIFYIYKYKQETKTIINMSNNAGYNQKNELYNLAKLSIINFIIIL